MAADDDRAVGAMILYPCQGACCLSVRYSKRCAKQVGSAKESRWLQIGEREAPSQPT